jgi:hypothetical protein
MKTLIGKFPGGYEEWAKKRGEEPVHRVMPPTTIGLELEERPIDNSTTSISSASISAARNEKMADNNHGLPYLSGLRTSDSKKPDMPEPQRDTSLNSYGTVGIIE